ncbi:hypothetical protein [Luteipulveratus mongoliensis]|uniref:Uncharacterized protein n=1 Tax=Luteipulveratus mongoliensis TaxID=571913 RepID=A0A0K1JNR4_9MICO|nr:hypothetical protein [Luteipulveratus mongoliensis]AKU18205.1 hypothetical protein VV02_24065 [Luteipulveratus mongoliensis]
MADSDHQLLRSKMALIGVLFAVLGIFFISLSRWLTGLDLEAWDWLHSIPFSELGATLFGIGVVGTAYDYYTRKEEEENATRRLRRTLKDEAPVMRDAVIEAFATRPEDLRRVATPELLDDLATNAMGLRLGDAQFAREIYTDVRDQAIRAAERWHDVDVRIRISTAVDRSTRGAPLFDVLVQWEYTTVPSHAVRRFACVSDRDEYLDLLDDVPATSCWFMTPRPGLDASSRASFELLSFSVNGEERAIRRSARKTGQTYSARIGDDLVEAAEPVRIKHLFRVVTPQSGHRLFFELAQPSRDVKLAVDYSDSDIAHLSISDLVTSLRRTEISRWPKQLGAKVISAELPGWVLPKAGFTLVWTLASEQSPDETAPAATSSVRRARSSDRT